MHFSKFKKDIWQHIICCFEIWNLNNCIPERGYYGSCMLFIRVCRNFLVFNLQAIFLRKFFFKFDTCIDMLEISPPYCFRSLWVTIESEMSQIRVKFANIIPLACVQPTGHIFAGISFRFAETLLWETSRHPIVLVALESKLSQK